MSDQAIFQVRSWRQHHPESMSSRDSAEYGAGELRLPLLTGRRLSRLGRRQQFALRLLRHLAAIRLEWSDRRLLEVLPPLPDGLANRSHIRQGNTRNAKFSLRRSVDNRSSLASRQSLGYSGQAAEAGLKLWALDWELIERRHRGN